MRDVFDVDLRDRELIDEIGLVTEMMVAAAASPEPLSQASIDEILRGSSGPAD